MVYLDNASSTCPKFHVSTYAHYWANPNSPHKLGLEANRALNEAKERIKKSLGVKSGEVLFCRCATEAVEWLCKQFHQYGDNLYTYASPYDHDSVTNNCCDVENIEECIEWEYLSRNCIYLHQHTNHITGTVFDIESIGKQVQSTGAFFGSDITASLGHYSLPDNLDTFCDALWFSGRKINCETMGAIWLSDRLFKYLGCNASHMITGTPNVPGALALADAVEYAVDNVKANAKHWELLTYNMLHQLHRQDIEAKVWNLTEPKTDAINALYLPGINADALVQYLSSKEIYISPGHSACSDESDYRVLEAFGLSKDEASQTVRVSFSEDTTEEEVEALVKGIVEFKNLFI